MKTEEDNIDLVFKAIDERLIELNHYSSFDDTYTKDRISELWQLRNTYEGLFNIEKIKDKKLERTFQQLAYQSVAITGTVLIVGLVITVFFVL